MLSNYELYQIFVTSQRRGMKFDEAMDTGLRAVAEAAVEDAEQSFCVPEGWMRDTTKVKELLHRLESFAYMPDLDGNPVCIDQAAAMSADVIRMVLIPLLAASQPEVK